MSSGAAFDLFVVKANLNISKGVRLNYEPITSEGNGRMSLFSSPQIVI